MKMADNVKNPKVLQQLGVRSGRVLFRYNEIELYSRAKLHYFQNNVIHSFKPMGNETLYQEFHLYTYIHTDTYLHIH